MQTLLSQLNRDEVLRYLGYQGTFLPPNLSQLIDSCMEDTLSLIQPKYVFRRFSLCKTEHTLSLKGTDLVLPGYDISEHLKNCHEIYLICLTIGLEIEKTIRRKTACAPEQSVIYDSCGSVAVEHLADYVSEQIQYQAAQEGLHTTWRFSPGYGDFPLETQREILSVMDAYRKIGLSSNNSFLLTPTKSVTAVIGITDVKKDPRINKCDYCSSHDFCEFRKRGTQC